MGIVRPDDLAFIDRMLSEGILLAVDTSKLDLSTGAIVVPCADCDQREDMIGHLEDLFRSQGHLPRIHPLSLNGGAIGIPIDSPLNAGDRRGSVLMEDIRATASPQVKGIQRVMLFGHYPCGAAKLYRLPLSEVIDLLMQAEDRVKREAPGLLVDCYFHVDRGGKVPKRTYFVSHRAWNAFAAAA